MATLATNLKKLMSKKKISESELGRQTTIGQPVINRMSSGFTYNPKISTLVPIAKYFGININQLIGDEPIDFSKLDNPSEFPVSHTVPLLSFEEAATWQKSESSLDDSDFIFTDIQTSNFAFGVKVNDSTMQPNFPADTVVIIDPKVKARNSDFVVGFAEGQDNPMFKQLLMDGETAYLKPLNEDFKILELDRKRAILGTMVQARINFNS